MDRYEPGSGIPITTVPNLRDLGGWNTANGEVRRGRVFRSAEFSGLEGADASAFSKLGIRTVYDFRTEAERVQMPNLVPDGVEYVAIDILADSPQAAAAALGEVVKDPQMANDMLGDGKATGLFESTYRDLVNLPSARQGYREFFEQLSRDEHPPALFHCTTGKDRTGWAAASFLLLLGVSVEEVFVDYLLTNQQLLVMTQPISDRFASAGGDPKILAPVLGVERAYLEAAIAEMQDGYGTIDSYFSDGLGLSVATIQRLRDDFLVNS